MAPEQKAGLPALYVAPGLPAVTAEIFPTWRPGHGLVRFHLPFEAPESGTRWWVARGPLWSMMAVFQPLAWLKDDCRLIVRLGGNLVPRDLWTLVTPKPGVTVDVMVVPRGGEGNKGFLTILLSVVVIAASIYSGGALAGPLGAALGISEAAAGALVSATVGIVGSLAVRALVPPVAPRRPGLGSTAAGLLPAITGTSNQANPMGPIPIVKGKMRLFPVLGAWPYTEVRRPDQYLRQIFIVGRGHYKISDIRIGQTPIGEFDEVTVEVRSGAVHQSPRRLFGRNVAQENVGVPLIYMEPVVRTTPQDCDRIRIDLDFPEGRWRLKEDGGWARRPVTVRVEYRKHGTTPWTLREERVYRGRRQPQRNTMTINPGERGLYDVRCTRLTVQPKDEVITKRRLVAGEWTEVEEPQPFPDRTRNQMIWSNLKADLNEDPISLDRVATISVAIKATDQLSGAIDSLSCVVEALERPYRDGRWRGQEVSRNPAWAYTSVLTGVGNAAPIPQSRLDGERFAAWAAFCDDLGLTFDAVFDTQGTVWERLKEIAAAGLARPAMRDGLFSVVFDGPLGDMVQVFGPRQYKSLRIKKHFVQRPHALRVNFLATGDTSLSEVIVYAPGYNKATATLFESIDAPGASSPRTARRVGRYHLAVAELRPEDFIIETDWASLRCEPGDRVGLQSPEGLIGVGTARVTAVTIDGGGALTALTFDDFFRQEPGNDYALRAALPDGTILLLDVVNDATAAAEILEVTTVTLQTPLPAGGDRPSEGDLCFFGVQGKDVLDCVVMDYLPGPDYTATLLLQAAADGLQAAMLGEDVDFDPLLTVPADMDRTAPPKPVIEGVVSDERAARYGADGTLQPRILVTIDPIEELGYPPDYLIARYRPAGGEGWVNLAHLPGNSTEVYFDVDDPDIAYDLRLRYRRGGRDGPEAAVNSQTAQGRLESLLNIDTVSMTGDMLSWTLIDAPADLAGYRLRHQPGENRVWDTATAAHGGLLTASQFNISSLPGGRRTFLVKAVDRYGNESAAPGALVTGLGDVIVDNVVAVTSLAPDFPGVLTNGAVAGGILNTENTGDFWSGDPANVIWTGEPGADFWTPRSLTMTYQWSYRPPVAGRLTMTLDILAPGGYSLEMREALASLIWTGEPAAALWSGNPDQPFWDGSAGAWQPWAGSAHVTARDYDFRLILHAAPGESLVRAIDLAVDVPDQTEVLNDVVLSASGVTRLPITKSYQKIVNVGLTLQDDGGGAVNVYLVDKSTAGPGVIARDAAAQQVQAGVDATIQGY